MAFISNAPAGGKVPWKLLLAIAGGGAALIGFSAGAKAAELPDEPPAAPPSPAEAALPAATGVSQVHVVGRGESLSHLAQMALGDPALWPLVYDMNRAAIGDDPDMLRTGVSLAIPHQSTITPERAACARRRAAKHLALWRGGKKPKLGPDVLNPCG